jgi:small subunit ribosomal protein S20
VTPQQLAHNLIDEMPTTKNAKKALRQSKKRRIQNRSQRSTLRKSLKKCRATVVGDDTAAAATALSAAAKSLDQAAAKNLIHRNKAARLKSRLAKLVNATAAANEAPADSE